ncbi:hypothetical protein MCOR25_004950 [Pyricularia grisea]|nr:hypothetical protein MCOR25_004950 [Pyricularia grisea]
MALGHAPLGLLGLVFIAGSLVMLFLTILPGVSWVPPLRDTYFLRAETMGIRGARPITQWTFFYVCGLENLNCGFPQAAMGIGSDAWAPGGLGAPRELVGEYAGGTTSHYYWYMWRFGWVFFIIGLFFEVIAFFVGFLACLGRLGAAMAGLVAGTALFFNTLAVCLMTATFVKMRNAFLANRMPAQIGAHGYGLAWGAWFALLIAVGLFFAGVAAGGGRKKSDHVHSTSRGSRRNRSRGSNLEIGSRRRVKEEYN